MSHPFAYCELHTADAGRAKDFYRRLFDWKMNDIKTPMGPYTELEPGEGFPGGLTGTQPGTPSHWVAYVRVDDVRAATAKARELGAQVLADSHEVPDAGWFSLLVDPAGARVGLWQPKAKTK